jgi:hypothetical protein
MKMKSSRPTRIGVQNVRGWLQLSTETVQFGFEAQQVIGLRLIKIATGGAAGQTEAARMITEKISAAAEAFGTLATGGSCRRILRRYRTHVKANRRRLSRRRSSRKGRASG